MRQGRKAPSFAGLRPASPLSSRIKKANTSSNTRHELELRRALTKLGLRFKRNVAVLSGRPDIVFPAAKVAVFCDGDFWHGRSWRSLRQKLSKGANAKYWCAKISRNRKRDRDIMNLLSRSGWNVVRVWESEIKRDARAVATQISVLVASKKVA